MMIRWGWLAALVVGLGASEALAAEAQERVAVVAVGSCEKGLADYARRFREALTRRPGLSVLGEDQMEAQLGGKPQGSLEGAQSRLDQAARDSKSKGVEETEGEVKAALAQLAALPPSKERFLAQAWGTYLEGYLLFTRGEQAKAASTLQAVYRVDPAYKPPKKLSPKFYDLAREVARKVAEAPSGQLVVASRPEGLTVYVGGAELGKTPLTTRLPQGEYLVEVGWGENRHGLPQQVHLGETAAAEFDKAFEGSVVQDGGPCLEVGSSKSAWVSALARLGGLLQVSRVFAVHLEENERRQQHLVGTAVDVKSGESGLEASYPVAAEAAYPRVMDSLVAHVTTGQATAPPVEVAQAPAEARATGAAPALTNPAGSTPAAAGGLGQPAPARGPSGLRIASYAAAGAGALALLGSGYFAYDARAAGRILDGDTLPSNDGYKSGTGAEVGSALGRIDRDNKLIVGLGVGGGAALVGAAVLFFVSGGEARGEAPPARPTEGGVAFNFP